MLNKHLIKSLLIIIFLLNCQQILSIQDLRYAAAKIIVKKNIQHDPLFRIYTGKTVLVNLSDAHEAYKKKNYARTGGNIALAAIAGVTFAAYPPEGKWESYTFPLSDNQTNTLKLATVITIINALANGFSTRKKNGLGQPILKQLLAFIAALDHLALPSDQPRLKLAGPLLLALART